MKVYHNSRCAKSRNTCKLLTENGAEYEIVEYLKNPISAKELTDILKKLNIPAADLVRKGETIYKELFKGKDLSEKQWVNAMVEHPKLMERPIVVKGKKAVIGRPPENALELLT